MGNHVSIECIHACGQIAMKSHRLGETESQKIRQTAKCIPTVQQYDFDRVVASRFPCYKTQRIFMNFW